MYEGMVNDIAIGDGINAMMDDGAYWGNPSILLMIGDLFPVSILILINRWTGFCARCIMCIQKDGYVRPECEK